ncbi:triphosphoribosyl-dephospho-CoA synthase [Salmonella enterica]|nr:triphosphoribosyl-dephospho-CoA synthase [Salmonella enterica]
MTLNSPLKPLKRNVAKRTRAPLSDKALSLWGKVPGHLSCRAMMEKVLLTSRPGLVDRRNSGSHRDMDIHSFTRSARVVADRLPEFVCLGYAQGGRSGCADALFTKRTRNRLRAGHVSHNRRSEYSQRRSLCLWPFVRGSRQTARPGRSNGGYDTLPGSRRHLPGHGDTGAVTGKRSQNGR